MSSLFWARWKGSLMWYTHCWPPKFSQNSERKPVFDMVSIFPFVRLFSASFTLWYVPFSLVLEVWFYGFFRWVCVMIQTSTMYYQAAVSCRESVANLMRRGFVSPFPILYPCLPLAWVVFSRSRHLQTQLKHPKSKRQVEGGRRWAVLNIPYLYGGRLRAQGTFSPCGCQVQPWTWWEDNPQAFLFFRLSLWQAPHLSSPLSSQSVQLLLSVWLWSKLAALAGERELLFLCFASALHLLT